LYIACETGHLEVVRLLVDAGANVDKWDKGDDTPLSIASQEGHYEIVRLLVDAGADLDNDVGRPLESARRCHHDDIVEMLRRAGATG
jgi:uncharacterized protein